MDLKNLVKTASATYDLAFDAKDTVEMCRRLRLAGFGSVVSAGATGKALDTILTISDQIKRRPSRQTPRFVYASLKREVEADADASVCPRCRTKMVDVMLVASRKAAYCASCSIALPVKTQ
jgi:uncharacterized protein with PIN domain